MELTIGIQTFRLSKMDAFRQFHVLRRMGTLFPSVTAALRAPDKLMSVGYIAASLARLSDDDANFVMNNCLAACQLKQAALWSNLVDGNGTLMFQDMELPVMLELVWKVLEYNFSPFMKDLLAKIPDVGVGA